MTTFTARALALAVHCLRRTGWVRELEAAQSWLASGPDAEARVLRATSGLHRFVLPLLALPPVRSAFLAAVERRVPGTVRHVLSRKLWFFTETMRTLESGPYERVAILGAGLDSLGLRLCEHHPRVAVLELDREDLVASKRRGLRHDRLDFEGGEGFAARMTLPDAPTVIVAEGVLMYLPPEEVTAIFERLAAHRHPVVFLLSYLHEDALSDPDIPAARLGRALAKRGEAFTWKTTPERLRARMEDLGWTLRETFEPSILHPKLLARSAPARTYGEWFAIAECA